MAIDRLVNTGEFQYGQDHNLGWRPSGKGALYPLKVMFNYVYASVMDQLNLEGWAMESPDASSFRSN